MPGRQSLIEFLAIPGWQFDRLAVALHVEREIFRNSDEQLDSLHDAIHERFFIRVQPKLEQRAFLVFQLAQVAGLSADVLHRLRKPEWSTIVSEIEAFSTSGSGGEYFTWHA